MDQKYKETNQNILGHQSTNWYLKSFEKAETNQIYEETDRQQIGETDTKYSEIPQQFCTFEGFPLIYKKKRNFLSVSVLRRFHVVWFPS